ncbi:hypothetical protein JI747_003290 [Chryseobacterium sp. RG1]|uniref:DKNYY family protein n=1 Tax=Chryseobacterium tagetis TaxID=2801334 RepID=A0ABS7ZYL0_9FLAO|nr:hypothetical protein [Chryseobacterium tagetis]MCA6066188.1 hypothetical protein [Chryseobacterium tagetis]
MFKTRYVLLLLFVSTRIFAQNNINTYEKYKIKYDSAFSKYFGKSFFKKNIKYSSEKYFLSVDTLDISNDDNSNTKNFFINKKNIFLLSKFYNNDQYFSFFDFYTYKFLYNGYSFYQKVYRSDFINNEKQFDFENEQVLDHYEKIKSKEYISPKKVFKIAKLKMFKNICSQSLVSNNYYKNKIFWEIKDCSNSSTINILELDSKDGKELRLYQRDYYPWEKANYWNKVQGKNKQIFIPSKQY